MTLDLAFSEFTGVDEDVLPHTTRIQAPSPLAPRQHIQGEHLQGLPPPGQLGALMCGEAVLLRKEALSAHGRCRSRGIGPRLCRPAWSGVSGCRPRTKAVSKALGMNLRPATQLSPQAMLRFHPGRIHPAQFSNVLHKNVSQVKKSWEVVCLLLAAPALSDAAQGLASSRPREAKRGLSEQG